MATLDPELLWGKETIWLQVSGIMPSEPATGEAF